jgi:hypothetical protein
MPGFETPSRYQIPAPQSGQKGNFLSVKNNAATRALLHTGDLAHEGGFSSAVVPHNGDMLAFAQFKICTFQRMDPSVVFGQVCRF